MHIVATAGHVDHGKSTLVRALTGIDPDRLAEEQARGLTIDLGFAATTLPAAGRVVFLDVPGHVRFIKNMLAGVGAVDACLLVVDVGEGWRRRPRSTCASSSAARPRQRGLVAVTKAATVAGPARGGGGGPTCGWRAGGIGCRSGPSDLRRATGAGLADRAALAAVARPARGR